jgi:anti-sigma regulatory factor (Ser/Thr protein kinase)
MEKRVLVARWLGSTTNSIPIYDEGSVSSARQLVRETALSVAASRNLVESVALIASELAHNQLAHARQGYLAVNAIERQGVKGLEVIAADLGPGIGKRILTDGGGVRSEGSLGAGLEGVWRLADEVVLDTRSAEGVCVVARKFESHTEPNCEIAVVGRPYPGEIISGDDSICIQSESGFVAAVCDGLGHGPEAREASNRAIDVVGANPHIGLGEILVAVNAAMAETRGCVIGLARFIKETRVLQCILAGDVRAQLYHYRDSHFFTPTPVILGGVASQQKRIRVEETPVAPGCVLVMFTDGLETKTNLKGQLEMLRRPAIAIAQHLIETHSRNTDDSLVFVARIK